MSKFLEHTKDHGSKGAILFRCVKCQISVKTSDHAKKHKYVWPLTFARLLFIVQRCVANAATAKPGTHKRHVDKTNDELRIDNDSIK